MSIGRQVYVVDDDDAMCRSLERLLRSADFVPTSYETPQAFLDAAPNLPAGCLLLDVRMPVMDGLELQARLRLLGISFPFVVMTGQGDTQMAVRAMKEGAVDFLEKPFDDDSLIGAVQAALAKSWQVDRDRESVAAAERLAALSPRERQVLDALVAGQANKSIAFDLGISVRTVEVHRARMMERLGTHQFAEAIRLAVMASLALPAVTDEP